jgi:hypothetical protein
VTLAVDHLVVAAATLAQGEAWCARVLGVAADGGGKHAFMGTHNRTLSIAGGSFPRSYLEIIAIDDDAQAPPHPRWFGLDDPALRRALGAHPRLIHWVARSNDIEAHVRAMEAAGWSPGRIVATSRQTPAGELRWRITIRDDGARAAEGVVPSLIQWDGAHPTDALRASGVTLASLDLHADASAARVLAACGPLQGVRVESGANGIVAAFRAPGGGVTLDST